MYLIIYKGFLKRNNFLYYTHRESPIVVDYDTQFSRFYLGRGQNISSRAHGISSTTVSLLFLIPLKYVKEVAIHTFIMGRLCWKFDFWEFFFMKGPRLMAIMKVAQQ